MSVIVINEVTEFTNFFIFFYLLYARGMNNDFYYYDFTVTLECLQFLVVFFVGDGGDIQDRSGDSTDQSGRLTSSGYGRNVTGMQEGRGEGGEGGRWRRQGGMRGRGG